MKKLLVVCLCFWSVFLTAQTNKIKKVSSYLMPQMALLNGSSGMGAQVQLSGGLVRDNWNFGIGTGIDYYELRSIPLYTDIRYHFGKQQKVFAYMNLGYNFDWVQKMDDKVYIMPPVINTLKYTGGLYGDWGIGYNIKISKHHSLALSTGFSIKQMGEEYQELLFSIWPWPVTNESAIRKFDYTFKRVSLKVAYRLW